MFFWTASKDDKKSKGVAGDDEEDEEAATADDKTEEEEDEDDDTAEDESPAKKAVVAKKKPTDDKKEDSKEVEVKGGSVTDKKTAKPEKPMTLGEISKVNDFITNSKVEGLQPLHTVSHQRSGFEIHSWCLFEIIVKLIYGVLGKAPTIKKNLRKFDGFEFESSSDEYKKKVEAAQKVDVAKLKAICDAFDIDKKGKFPLKRFLVFFIDYWLFLIRRY